MGKLRGYRGNLDGLRAGFVVAANQKEAAEAIGDSLYGFRQFWSRCEKWPVQDPKPNTLYTCDNRDIYGAGPEAWHDGRCSIKR